MPKALAVILAYLVLAGTGFLFTRTDAELIEFRDTVLARLGFNIPSDTLAIHTGAEDCWYE